MFNRPEKITYMKKLMWDYNIPPEHCLEVLEGTRQNAGHYTADTLFRKMIESLPWFTIVHILEPERILQLLTDQTIQSLRFKSLSRQYQFIRGRLQKIV